MPFEFVVVAGILGLVGFGIYAGYRAQKQRREALLMVCQTLGFRWQGEGDTITTHDLPIFDRGHGRKTTNVMEGELAGHAVTVMDYRYVTGGGKNSQTHHQTLALFPAGAAGLPDFELAPENILHKLGQVFGYQDLDFPENEEFSKRYLLRGADEGAIRRTFNATVLAFLAGKPGWSVQTRGGAAVLFQARTRCKPDQLPSFLADALQILGGLGARSAA